MGEGNLLAGVKRSLVKLGPINQLKTTRIQLDFSASEHKMSAAGLREGV